MMIPCTMTPNGTGNTSWRRAKNIAAPTAYASISRAAGACGEPAGQPRRRHHPAPALLALWQRLARAPLTPMHLVFGLLPSSRYVQPRDRMAGPPSETPTAAAAHRESFRAFESTETITAPGLGGPNQVRIGPLVLCDAPGDEQLGAHEVLDARARRRGPSRRS